MDCLPREQTLASHRDTFKGIVVTVSILRRRKQKLEADCRVSEPTQMVLTSATGAQAEVLDSRAHWAANTLHPTP